MKCPRACGLPRGESQRSLRLGSDVSAGRADYHGVRRTSRRRDDFRCPGTSGRATARDEGGTTARRPRVLLLTALLLCAAGPSRAETYDYVVDRFEADGNVNGPFDGVFILKDLGAGGATLYDITLLDGVTAFQQACDPRDKRTSKGYVNKSNALPPACVPGSANGFQKLTMRWSGVNDVRIQIKNTTLPAVVGPIQATVYDGTGLINECDGWVGEAPCIARGKSVRCDTD
jgi:hypothetical protein